MNKFTLFLCVMSLSGNVAFGADSESKASHKKMPPLTTEQRQKMADAHEKMAVCLRSDKPLNECQEEMMKACKKNMGKSGCSMMGGKGMEMHHQMMDQDKNGSDSNK